ncbi:MAG: hypothetical protein JNM23_00195 [Bradyrhizobiaceae bacterium]|nr:hypothetical protein [Bradyrhizobiaceae bacterium]
MTKSSNPSKASHSAKDFPALGTGYREIGIAAVAAAVRCQHMGGHNEEHPAGIRDSVQTDRLP